MYSILIAVFIIKILPSFLDGYFTLEEAYNICRMSDYLVIILLSWFAYLTIAWEKGVKKCLIKVVSMLSLVVSIYYMVNYVFVSVDYKQMRFEQVDG